MQRLDHVQHAVADHHRHLTRRWFFRDCGMGLGLAALHALLADTGRAAPAGLNPMAPKKPHQEAKAKRVIYLFQAGAPSHLELFDHTVSQLAERSGPLVAQLSGAR